MAETAGEYLVERPLPRVAEGRVAQVVAQRDGLGQILIEPQRAGYGPGDARDLEGVGQAGAVVVALRLQKDLGLVLEAPEGLAMGYAIHVALEAGAYLALRLRTLPSLAVGGTHAALADQRQLVFFSHFPRTGHVHTSFAVYLICRRRAKFLPTGKNFLKSALTRQMRRAGRRICVGGDKKAPAEGPVLRLMFSYRAASMASATASWPSHMTRSTVPSSRVLRMAFWAMVSWSGR